MERWERTLGRRIFCAIRAGVPRGMLLTFYSSSLWEICFLFGLIVGVVFNRDFYVGKNLNCQYSLSNLGVLVRKFFLVDSSKFSQRLHEIKLSKFSKFVHKGSFMCNENGSPSCALLQSRVEILALTFTGHIYPISAPIDVIWNSTGIYSKRTFKQWIDWANLTLRSRIMANTSFYPWEN